MRALSVRHQPDSLAALVEADAELDILDAWFGEALVKPPHRQEYTSFDHTDARPEGGRIAIATLMDEVMPEIGIETRRTRRARPVIVGPEGGSCICYVQLGGKFRNRVFLDHDIGVHEHQQIAICPLCRPVTAPAWPDRSAIINQHLRTSGDRHRAGVVGRSIIEQDDLNRLEGRCGDRLQAIAQSFLRIIGRNDDGDRAGHR